ncbi:MAG: hypothetical protein KDJ38_10115 [Gammaproteobacteria bacterium]|nr:hypothetical protein [Gammaproteobacteria bacterium]
MADVSTKRLKKIPFIGRQLKWFQKNNQNNKNQSFGIYDISSTSKTEFTIQCLLRQQFSPAVIQSKPAVIACTYNQGVENITNHPRVAEYTCMAGYIRVTIALRFQGSNRIISVQASR